MEKKLPPHSWRLVIKVIITILTMIMNGIADNDEESENYDSN